MTDTQPDVIQQTLRPIYGEIQVEYETGSIPVRIFRIDGFYLGSFSRSVLALFEPVPESKWEQLEFDYETPCQ